METKTGRPSKYKPELDEQAEKLCRLGATDKEIAAFFGVRESTLNNWKLKHPSFVESLKRGKDEVDGLVEQSLFRRAMGYSHQSEKVFQYQGAIVRAKTVEHYPPDTTACIFWLKNRQPDSWRDRREENQGSDDVQTLLRKLIAGLPA